MEQALLHSLFFSLSLYVGFSLAELIGFIYPEMMLPLLIFMYFDSLFPSVLVSLMTIYLLHCYGESLLRSTLFCLVAVLWLLCFIMLDMTLFTKLFYYISSENQLLRGPLYPLMVGVLYVIIILNLISCSHHT